MRSGSVSPGVARRHRSAARLVHEADSSTADDAVLMPTDAPPRAEAPPNKEAESKLKRNQTFVFVLTYLTYASLYFTRKPFSVVKKTILSDDSLVGFKTSTLNVIETGFLFLYAIGQFMIGPLGDRFGARRMLFVGFLGSAVTAAVCGMSESATPFIIAWSINGVFQAGAFPLIMKAMAPWFSRESRGSVLGFWTTCQQIGGVTSTAYAGYMLQAYGWRSAFLLPAAMVAGCAFALFFFLVEDPATVGVKSPAVPPAAKRKSITPLPDADPAHVPTVRSEPLSFLGVARLPFLMNLGAAYFCIKLVRYTLMFWLPFYLEDRFGYPPATAAYLSTLFDIGGAIGSVGCGIVSDKFAGGRRMYVAAPMAFLAGLGLSQYTLACSYGMTGNAVMMTFIGLMIAGPDSVLGGASCTDVCERAGAGAAVVTTASGIVNGMGSIGAILQASLATFVSENYGWDSLFSVLAALSIGGALCVTPYVLADMRAANSRVAMTVSK